jgi:hypothetical protein
VGICPRSLTAGQIIAERPISLHESRKITQFECPNLSEKAAPA